MKNKVAIRFFTTIFCGLLVLPTWAGTTPLKAGDTATIDCVNGNSLNKKTIRATGSQSVAARVTLSLDSTGTVLTVNVQNTSLVSDAMLYALDLGLSDKFVTSTRMVATFSGFPAGGRWFGPTDTAGPTNATGTATFAAREAIAGRMDDYLNRQTTLKAGFLRVGQGGTIIVKLTLAAAARNKPLLIDPVAYFLVNDPQAQTKRTQIVSTGVVRTR